MFLRLLGWISLLSLISPNAFAQREVWSDARVRAAARQRALSVRLSVADAAVSRAEQTFGTTPRVGNPTLGVMYLPGFPDEGALTAAASLALPIEVSGERGRWQRETDRGVRAAEARIDAASADAEANARIARVEIALSERLIQNETSRLAIARDNESRVHLRVAAGASTAVDESLAEQERAEAEADLALARQRYEQHVTDFRNALDLDPTEPVAVDAVGRPEVIPVEATEAFIHRALRARRDIAAYQLAATRLRLSDARLRAAAIAPLMVGLEAQQVSVGPNQVANSIGASVRWELPFVQRAQAPRAVARAEAAREQLRAELLQREVAREVAGALRSLQHAVEALVALEDRAVPAAERLVAATESSWLAGSLDYFRVISARRELFTLRRRAVEAAQTAWHARIALDRALGGAP